MIVGTAMLIRLQNNKILGLECAKGRGTILPGGKVEKRETYRQAARRECFEETGIEIDETFAKLVFQGFSTYKGESYCFTYEAKMINPNQLASVLGSDFGSGKVGVYHWGDFMDSKYAAYYDALFQTVGILE